MKAPGFHLAEWWGRLTRQTMGEPPEVLPAVQPVLIVSDQKWLSGPPELAHGLCGFSTAGIAGFPTHLNLQAGSPGGILIRAWQVGSGQGIPTSTHDLRIKWTIGITPVSLGGVPGGGVTSLTPGRPCRSRASSASAASNFPPLGGDIPTLFGGVGLSTPQIASPFFHWVPPLWVPPGSSLYFETQATQTGMFGWIMFTELDAPRSIE